MKGILKGRATFVCEAISNQDNGSYSVLREITRASGCKQHTLWLQELRLAPSLGFGPQKRAWAPSDLGTVLMTAVSHGRLSKALQSSMQVTANLQVQNRRTDTVVKQEHSRADPRQAVWVQSPALPSASKTQSKLHVITF